MGTVQMYKRLIIHCSRELTINISGAMPTAKPLPNVFIGIMAKKKSSRDGFEGTIH